MYMYISQNPPFSFIATMYVISHLRTSHLTTWPFKVCTCIVLYNIILMQHKYISYSLSLSLSPKINSPVEGGGADILKEVNDDVDDDVC